MKGRRDYKHTLELEKSEVAISNGQSRDTWHKTQNEDKQNKRHNTES